MKPRRPQLAPSILAADFARLGEQIKAVEPLSSRIHVDVMDGHFVPNLSMGPGVVASMRPVTTLPIEAHLMVERPESFVEPFAQAGADRIVFHLEAEGEPAQLARSVAEAGAAAGIALRPATPWGRAKPFLELVDLVIIMTVEPGFGGQAFLHEMLPKVRAARESVMESGLDVDIEVDGGVDAVTAVRALEAGANVFVAGTSIFNASDPAAAALDVARAVGVDA